MQSGLLVWSSIEVMVDSHSMSGFGKMGRHFEWEHW